MNRITTLIVITALAFTGRALAQDVAYEKYQLPNGMTVILHEDHSVPSACINLWYYVASKDEEPGRSGFAHLFEHLMFMGTNRVPGGNFDTIMEGGGGFNNASTSEDRTNYYSLGPAELLPTLLWLDADRLEDLGKAMTQEKLDKQRAIVRNERRQSYENRPYGKSQLKVQELMYPEGHPYRIPVIGTHEDLEAATVDDVKNFFANYYVPSNASLVVAGDFDPGTIKPLIDSMFGSLPRGAVVKHAEAEPARLDSVKRLTMTDTVQYGRTTMVYHSPAHYAPGDADLDLAGAILSDGISSRLYQELVYENELAVDVSAYQSSMLLGSLFYVEATAKPGVALADIERAIDKVLAEFTSNGPTQEELERQKTQLEYQAISRLQSLLAKADALNRYQFFFGEPNSFKADLDRHRNATARSVQQWAKRVLTPDARLILRVIPELKPTHDKPRDVQPALASAQKFVPPAPATFKLDNGITVHHWQRSELPLVQVSMLMGSGTTSDPPGRGGLATLTADMLDEGAGDLGAMQFADALDLLGASFRASSGRESGSLTLSVLTRNLEPAMKLYADAILRPRFNEKEWQRVHKLHVQRLAQLLDRPTYVAQTVSMKAFFGNVHPYSRPTSGTKTSATAVSLAGVKRFHAQTYRPSNATLLVAGDLSSREAKRMLNASFGTWSEPTGTPTLATPLFPPPANSKLRVVIVDRPDAVQTVVQFVMPGPVYANPDRPKLQLFNTILGGSFTSRLNQNLREEHGYTYGARCRFTMSPSVGYFTASSSVRADVTGASLGEFLKEFANIRSADITTEEAGKARASRRMGMIQSFAGLRGIIGAATTLVRNGRPFSDLGDELQMVAGVTASDLNRLAYKAVPLEEGLLVLVGDRKLILEQLKGLDLPQPTELSTDGTSIGG